MNFKTDLLAHLQAQRQWEVESNLHEGLECDVLKPLGHAFRLELWYFIDNGEYSQLADVRFKHPQSPGYTRLQAQFPCNLPNVPIAYTEEAVYGVLAMIQERLALGWTERLYFNDGKHYKSLIELPRQQGKPSKLVYREETKGLPYILLSSILGKPYRALHPKISEEVRHIRPLS